MHLCCVKIEVSFMKQSSLCQQLYPTHMVVVRGQVLVVLCILCNHIRCCAESYGVSHLNLITVQLRIWLMFRKLQITCLNSTLKSIVKKFCVLNHYNSDYLQLFACIFTCSCYLIYRCSDCLQTENPCGWCMNNKLCRGTAADCITPPSFLQVWKIAHCDIK